MQPLVFRMRLSKGAIAEQWLFNPLTRISHPFQSGGHLFEEPFKIRSGK
jgi:hypothetical protein